jgi:hypothetical protein
MTDKPKERLSTKRNFLSQRNENHKSGLSLHTNLSKLMKPSLNSTTLRADLKKNKKYQSAHASPNRDKSIENIQVITRRNLLKASEKLTTALLKTNKSSA